MPKVVTSAVPMTGEFRKVMQDSDLRRKIMERLIGRGDSASSQFVQIGEKRYRVSTRPPVPETQND